MMQSHAPSGQSVVFHADDFGMNPAVNQGIEISFRNGVLTSTSLLANAPAALSACQSWPAILSDLAAGSIGSAERRRQLGDPMSDFDLGIHLNLTQGQPLTGGRFPAELLDEDGNFPGIGKLFARLNHAPESRLPLVENELRTQIEWMCDQGLRPTHLNGHQYIEMIPQIAKMIPTLLRDFEIPTVRVAYERGLFRNVLCQRDVTGWVLGLVKRHFARSFRQRMKGLGVAFPDRFFGTSHAGRIDAPTMGRFLRQSRAAGLTEIGIHPGNEPAEPPPADNDPWFDPLSSLRAGEMHLLCSQELVDRLGQENRTLGRLQSCGRIVGKN